MMLRNLCTALYERALPLDNLDVLKLIQMLLYHVGDIKNGGAAGALIGGILGHNNSKATGGTKRVCNIETRYEEQARQVYSHSIVTFTYNGKQQALRFTK